MTTATIIALAALVAFLTGLIFRLTKPPQLPPPEPVPVPVPAPEPTPGPAPGPSPIKVYTVDSDLRQPSYISAAQLDAYFKGFPMAGLGQVFVAAEAKYGDNAVYLAAHAAWESDYGRSPIAQQKKNLFGYGASGTDPFQNAKSFPSFEACIDFVAGYVARAYLSPSGQYYGGAPSLRGMNVHYAADQNWMNGIAAIMNRIVASLGHA
ncbi:MAG: glucosaminidase domain-containing protein [Bacillota bacterium]